ncbi:MAG TPA: peptidoglycan-binding domain-containing protein [Candidatus Paceibacterota bacterium]|jgi:hypothetical protein|nr:peptidoglycan-binding domain-containing protein [Candidatus Paceibacterota bacterium]
MGRFHVGAFVVVLLLLSGPLSAYGASPIGYFDGIDSNGIASGWTFDPDASSTDLSVQLYMDGPVGSGTLIGQTIANSPRPDVNTAMSVTGDHGFLWHIPSQYLTASHTWYAYGLDSSTQAPSLLINSQTLGNSQTNLVISTPGFISGVLKASIITTTGAYMTASYPGCTSSATKIDLYVTENGRQELHNRCYIDSPADPNSPSGGFCPFQFPLKEGESAGNVTIRIWRITPDCTKYADEAGNASGYDDFPIPQSQTVQEETTYPAATQARLVTIDRPTYRAKIDPHGGATYEFYSKRMTSATLATGELATSLHADMGAALQIAFHSGAPDSLTAQPCAGQGYYNPTQAGSSCTYSGVAIGPGTAPGPADPKSGLVVMCDGLLNNFCTSALSTLSLSLHRMMNWDYGPGYEGPYNDHDQMYLAQTTTAYDDYLQYDVQLENKLSQPIWGALEIPTYYFTNQFRRYYYPNQNGGVTVGIIPINRSGIDSQNFSSLISGNVHWVTFENSSEGLGLANNYYVTIAWFYAPETQQALDPTWVDYGLQISDTAVYHQIKMSNVPALTLQPNNIYKFRYVVFPFRYDEMVNSKFGTLSVEDTIARMRAEYENPAPTPAPSSTPPSAPIISGSESGYSSPSTGSSTAAIFQAAPTTSRATSTASGGSAAISASGTGVAAYSCPALARNLSFGSRGADVIKLQQFLAYEYSNFYSSYVTGYFGPITQSAVKQLQREHSIVSFGTPSTTGYGNVGPRTRAAIAALCEH